MSYAILGYLMIALIVVLLLTNKATPITAYYNVFTVEGTAASRVFFRIVA